MVREILISALVAVSFWMGYWRGQRYERRRVLVITGDKHGSLPSDDACCCSALRDVDRDIIRGTMPKLKEE